MPLLTTRKNVCIESPKRTVRSTWRNIKKKCNYYIQIKSGQHTRQYIMTKEEKKKRRKEEKKKRRRKETRTHDEWHEYFYITDDLNDEDYARHNNQHQTQLNTKINVHRTLQVKVLILEILILPIHIQTYKD